MHRCNAVCAVYVSVPNAVVYRILEAARAMRMSI
jgi:hypothetical protein